MTDVIPIAWLFPSVATPRGGVLRGRAFKTEPDRGGFIFLRNLRSIVAARELAFAHLRVHLCGRVLEVRADAEGFFAVDLDPRDGLWPLGRHEVTASIGPVMLARGALHVVPETGLSVVSDFDDTIAVSHVTRKLRMLATALLRNETGHEPVAGMAPFYRALADGGVAAFHYLSGTPVGLMRRTMRFLSHHGFPEGALTLRHMESEPFDGLRYKAAHLERIAAALPGHAFVLVGDSGEKDPEVFAQIRERLCDRVRAIFVRRVTDEPAEAARFAGMFVFDRAEDAAAEARRMGLAK